MAALTGLELLAAAGLDVTIGDPRWLPHPVRAMGRLIGWFDRHVRTACRSPLTRRLAGVGAAVVLPGVAYLAGHLIIELAAALSAGWELIASILLASTTLAGRDLVDHARAVSRALATHNLQGAREAVALIVGRDTVELSEPEVVRAAVETIAESSADGVIAPLLYLTLGGAPLALAYKAINTLDSMIGHRDPDYIDVGWASARLDDVANWVPARLTAGLLVVSTGLVSGRWHRLRESARILYRDGRKHPSPNSGRPEAAMAGALGIQLGGVNHYDGHPVDRPHLGDAARGMTAHDIERATALMLVTYGLGVALAVGARWLW
jgi:adenosylcobinamide-phosphate synthase